MEIFDSLSSACAIILLVASLIAFILSSYKRPPGFPPGPRGLPIVGCILDVGRSPHISFMNLAKKYGDIFSIKLGSHTIAVLNNVELVNEALIKKFNDFAGRPYIYSTDIFSEGRKDIIFGDFGPTWKLHRKLSHAAMRSYASGQTLERLVIDEAFPKLRDLFRSKAGEEFDVKPMLMLVICNIMATVCFNRKYSLDDEEFLEFVHTTEDMVHGVGNGLLADFLHWAKYLPTPGPSTVKKLTERFTGFLRKKLDEHRRNFDKDNLRDLTDHLIHAQNEAVQEDAEHVGSLTETHMVQTLSDMFGAGIDTSSIAMNWCIVYMVKHPDIQATVAREIDTVIGRDRQPALSDRGSLPYCEAVIREVLRIQTVAPLGIPHSACVDSSIGGYNIPKDTCIMINLWALHNDEREWDEPRNFKAERFLDDTGRLKPKPASFMPFSAGRRVCLGESLAKAQLFLLFTSLFQNFTVFSAQGSPPRLDGFSSIFVNHPHPYKICARERN